MTITDSDLLVLNTIIYTPNFNGSGASMKNKSVYDWAEDYKKNGSGSHAEVTEEEMKNIVNTILKDPDKYSNIIIKDVDNQMYDNPNTPDPPEHIATNVTFTSGDDMIIAYKGTGGALEWRDNGHAANLNVTDSPQQIAALDYFNKQALDKDGNKLVSGDIYVTGHSKGGNKAQYVTIMQGDKITKATAFDGQGFNLAFHHKYQEQIQKNKSKITVISNEYDYVNLLMFPVAGHRHFVKNNWTMEVPGLDGLNGKAFEKWKNAMKDNASHEFRRLHSPYTLGQIDENGSFVIGELKDQARIMTDIEGYLQHLLTYANEEDARFIYYMVMSKFMGDKEGAYKDIYADYSKMPDGFKERILALTKGYFHERGWSDRDVWLLIESGILFGGDSIVGTSFREYKAVTPERYSTITRDFTEETKNKLLSIVSEVENESFFDIGKWDIWYRIEDLVVGTDYPSNQNDLNGYYRKIIDMQGTTKEEIERIFSAVASEESGFNGTLSGIKENVQKIKDDLDKVTQALSKFA